MVTRIMVGTFVEFDTLPSLCWVNIIAQSIVQGKSAERAASRQIKQHLTPVEQRLEIVIRIKALPLRFDF